MVPAERKQKLIVLPRVNMMVLRDSNRNSSQLGQKSGLGLLLFPIHHPSSGVPCATKFCSCAHQGESDVTRHIQSEKHQKNVRAKTNAAPLSSFGFISNSDPLKDKVRH